MRRCYSDINRLYAQDNNEYGACALFDGVSEQGDQSSSCACVCRPTINEPCHNYPIKRTTAHRTHVCSIIFVIINVNRVGTKHIHTYIYENTLLIIIVVAYEDEPNGISAHE